MANTQYMDLLREILESTDWKYGEILVDGDGYNDEVFLYESYGNDVKELNKLCKAKLKENGIDTYPDYDREEWYVDFITGDNWGYNDEYYVCCDCGKAYRNNDYGIRPYWVGDGFIYCEDCVKENHKEEYIEYLTNNPQHANSMIDLEEEDFEKINEYPYENGMYGTNDCPTEIYEKLIKIYPNSEIVFSISSSNPFAVYFDVYIRKADEDINGDRYIETRTGNVMSYDEMKQYCKEQYDYGDSTNAITYLEHWYKEYGFEKVA